MDFYYDEKGPTKTIKPTSINPTSFNFENSDSLDELVSIFTGFEDSSKVAKDLENWKTNVVLPTLNNHLNKSELKSTYLTPKRSMVIAKGLAAFNSKHIRYYSSLFDILLENKVSIHLSVIDKLSTIISTVFDPWFRWIDVQKNPQHFIRHSFIYGIVKFLVLEREYSANFFNSIMDIQIKQQNMPIKKLLDLLVKDIKHFIEINEKQMKFMNTTKQIKDFIKTIKYYSPPYSLKTGSSFKMQSSDLYYGFKVFIDELQESEGEIYNYQNLDLYFDKNALNYSFINDASLFNSVNIDLDSAEYPGIQISDFLAGIIGLLLSSINEYIQNSSSTSSNDARLPNEWFEIEEEMFYMLKKLNTLIFTKSIHSIFHNEYCDNLTFLQAYIYLITKYDTWADYQKAKEELPLKNLHFNIFDTITKRYGIEQTRVHQRILNLGTTYTRLEYLGHMRPLNP